MSILLSKVYVELIRGMGSIVQMGSSPPLPAPPTSLPADLEHEVSEAYEQYAAELLAYATLLLGGGDGAQDRVQDAFLRYFAERRYGRMIENPRAWLFRVVHNRVLDVAVSTAKKREIPSESLPDVPDYRPGPEQAVHQVQAVAQIESLLTGREIDCLRLRARGMSYEEVGDALGVRAGTVSALLSRVYQKLRTSVGQNQTRRLRTAEALRYVFQEA
jgi:RNA polymerase sigma factor (sigma-70 family)